NQVDPGRGIIEYRAGSMNRSEAYPGGTVARIVFRMLREAGTVRLWFELADPQTGRRVTDIRDAGVSLLGPTDTVAAEALHDVQVAVRPLNLRENWSPPNN